MGPGESGRGERVLATGLLAERPGIRGVAWGDRRDSAGIVQGERGETGCTGDSGRGDRTEKKESSWRLVGEMGGPGDSGKGERGGRSAAETSLGARGVARRTGVRRESLGGVSSRGVVSRVSGGEWLGVRGLARGDCRDSMGVSGGERVEEGGAMGGGGGGGPAEEGREQREEKEMERGGEKERGSSQHVHIQIPT